MNNILPKLFAAVNELNHKITPICDGCEYIDVFRTGEMTYHNGTHYGGWVGRFIFHEQNMSFTWNGGALYRMTKLLNRKYRIKQTVKYLMDMRIIPPNFNYTVHQDIMRIEVG